MRIPELRVTTSPRGLALLATAVVCIGCTAPAALDSQAPSISVEATSSVPASAGGKSDSAEPTPAATSQPSGSEGWTQVATLGEGEGWDVAKSVARGRDAFVAVGSRWVPAGEAIYVRPLEHIWVSDDGRTWDEVPMSAELAGAALVDVITTPEGGFVVFGTTGVTVAWQSADGRHWEELTTNLGPDVSVEDVVQGSRGYLLRAYVSSSSDRSLWHSDDGVAWEEVRHFPAEDGTFVSSIGAGEQGFVAIGSRSGADGDPEPAVFASADGSTWFEAPQAFGLDQNACTGPLVTAVGGDWVVVSAMPDDPPQVWYSEDGLDWESMGSIANVNVPACGEAALTYAAGQLLFSPSIAFHSLSSAVWSSTDGRDWELWEPGGDAAVVAAIDSPIGAVAVGAAVQDVDAAIASFWFASLSR